MSGWERRAAVVEPKGTVAVVERKGTVAVVEPKGVSQGGNGGF